MGAAINPYPLLPKEGEGAAGSRDIENVRQVHKKSPENLRGFCKILIFNIFFCGADGTTTHNAALCQEVSSCRKCIICKSFMTFYNTIQYQNKWQ